MQFDVNKHWYRSSYTLLTLCLLPLSWIFRIVVLMRQWLYRFGIKKTYRCAVPVIVIGNITVGGTGKTPLTIWLAHFLKVQGWQPGIVTRGYGGKSIDAPQSVHSDSDVKIVGDEAVLLAQRADCPVVVCADRMLAVEALLKNHQCNIVISDDGLQHYRLGRDIEIVVIDGERRFGNGALLPAGPLREPIARLKKVNFKVSQQYAGSGEYLMRLYGNTLVSLIDPQLKKPLREFRNAAVHACAAIGNPARFIADLKTQGLNVKEHIFPDHYLYQKEDLNFGDDLPIIMTEKDSVKCKNFADRRYWYLPVNASLESEFERRLLEKLSGISCR